MTLTEMNAIMSRIDLISKLFTPTAFSVFTAAIQIYSWR
jgi:hypothetical protein